MPANISHQTSTAFSRRASRFSILHIMIMLISSVFFFGGMITGLCILYFSKIPPVYSLVIFMVLAGVMYAMVCSLSFYHCAKRYYDTKPAPSNQTDVTNGASTRNASVELNTPTDRHPFEVRGLFPPISRSTGTPPPPPYMLNVPERLNMQAGNFKVKGSSVRGERVNEETFKLNEFAFEKMVIARHRNGGQPLVRNQKEDFQSNVAVDRGQKSDSYPKKVPDIVITPAGIDSGRILQSHRMLPNTCQEGNTADISGQRKTFLRCPSAQNSQRYLMVPSRTSTASSSKTLQRKSEAEARKNIPTTSNLNELIETSQEDLSMEESRTSREDLADRESTSPECATKIAQQGQSDIRRQYKQVHKMNVAVKSTDAQTVANCPSSTSTARSSKILQPNLQAKATTNTPTRSNSYELINTSPEDLTVEESSTSEDLTGSESTLPKCSAKYSIKRVQQEPSNMRKQYNEVYKMNIPVQSTHLKTVANEKRKVSNPELKVPLYLVNKKNPFNKNSSAFLGEV